MPPSKHLQPEVEHGDFSEDHHVLNGTTSSVLAYLLVLVKLHRDVVNFFLDNP